MKDRIFYFAGSSDALHHAVAILKGMGCCFSPVPDTRVTHVLLDIPHRNWDAIPALLDNLSHEVTVVGGMLDEKLLGGYKTTDLLQDPFYLAENANITAHCAVRLILSQLPITLHRCPVLVIGGGRIGRCLAQLTRHMGAQVTVAARKETDRAMLSALGYNVVDTAVLPENLASYRVICNTVPAPVLSEEAIAHCQPNCLKIELASLPGMAGNDILLARGLPNRYAPETSGELIAHSILRLS